MQMMYTLDANIFVRDLDAGDTNHQVCSDLLSRLHATQTVIVMPRIVLAEVAGAIRRETGDTMRARMYVLLLQSLSHITFSAVDEQLTEHAVAIAADYALRGMDAIYVATAHTAGCALVTFDREVRQRAARLVTVQTPAEVLAGPLAP